MLTVLKLQNLTIVELKKIAQANGIKVDSKNTKLELMKQILKVSAEKQDLEYVSGSLSLVNKASHGLIKVAGPNFTNKDIYVSSSQISKFSLRRGDIIEGVARKSREKEKYRNLLKVDFVGGELATESIKRAHFMKKVPVFPDKQMILETKPEILSTRIIDILSPIGFGQRGMIVAQPKSGKTWLMQEVANGITANHPEVQLMVVLIGERPEEVTDMRRSVKGEVWASNFDEHPKHNVEIAELALERAKRLVEWGKHVVILMDSLTRLARAYNLCIPSSGRTLSGGFDPMALFPPKKFFGAARNFEDGGSLTIIATALTNTGSRMDDLIYEEFKGTGNMELHLDRSLANKRVYPAIDVTMSSTRREDLLLDPETVQLSWLIRKMLDTLSRHGNDNPTIDLINKIKQTKNNKEFLDSLRR